MSMTTTGTTDVARNFRSLAASAQDVSGAWRQVGLYLTRRVRAQFRTQGQVMGRRKWRPLKPATVRQKRRLGYPADPLVRTGALKRSLTSRPMDIERYRGNSARFGTRVRYAQWQQKGTRRGGKRHIPPRPMLVASRQVRADVKDIIADHLRRRGVPTP